MFHIIFISNHSYSDFFLYDIIFTQTNIGLIPFAYTLRLESESQGTEVTLTSSKYLSLYCFDFGYTTYDNFVLIIMFYTCYHLLSCTTLNDMIPQTEEIISVKLRKS